MKRITITLLLAGIIGFFFAACSNNPEEAPAGVRVDNDEIDLSDFYEFYRRFHNDSLFQVNHVVFPLKGLPRDADSALIATGNYYWDRESWAMHRPFDFEMSEFEREIIPFRSNMIEERIIHQQTGTGMIRRFAKLSDDEWNLIYYADLNHIRRGQ